MADNPRIESLRRRIQKDPASIAFAQLGEELRRAGQQEEAIEVCRVGLDHHPEYLSARVTLGRALLEINQLKEAQSELEVVFKTAKENLAAVRGLAEIHERRGALPEALKFYRMAVALSRADADLEQKVAELAQRVQPTPEPVPAPRPVLVPPPAPPPVDDGATVAMPPPSAILSTDETIVAPPPWMLAAPPPPAPADAPAAKEAEPAPAVEDLSHDETIVAPPPWMLAAAPPADALAATSGDHVVVDDDVSHDAPTIVMPLDLERERAAHLLSVLELWLEAIHVVRAERRA